MPRATWPLLQGRPTIEVVLSSNLGAQTPRVLLADTGGGSVASPFELLLDIRDCLAAGGAMLRFVRLHGAFPGSHSVYGIRILLPQLGFDQVLRVVGIPIPPTGMRGTACFRFLNRFSYGNFGDPSLFGLET